MKPIPAIVEPAEVDLALIGQQLSVALAGKLDAERTAERHDKAGAAARESARMRRLEIGQLLCKARPAWPERGPTAKGWGAFLAQHGLDDSTARRYMDEYRDPAGFAQKNRGERNHSGEAGADETSDDDTGARPPTPAGHGELPPFRQLSEGELVQALGRLDPAARKRVLSTGKANAKGGSGEDERGTWCTSKEWAIAVGAWDLDPFSNPRSKIASASRCMLEDGGDGFGGGEAGATPGLFLVGARHGLPASSGIADAVSRVWIQPPYELVEAALAHYGHTRFCALLRWSPDVKSWFPGLWARTAVVCHPFGARMGFDPPPGVEASGDMPFPHALYYADERDVTDAVRTRCLVWRIDHALDCAQPNPAALHIVR